ncbi:MAG: hypothetical protein MI919_33205, partial [Holophagales bacterium]|nr:hypothetical protein [Holophagales bacterium]
MPRETPEATADPFVALRRFADRFSGPDGRGGACLLAVAVPSGQVTAAIADSLGPSEVVEGAEVRAARPDAGGSDTAAEATAWATVLRLRDRPWTLVLAGGDANPLASVEHLGPLALDLSLAHDAEALIVQAVPERSSPEAPSPGSAEGIEGAGDCGETRLAWGYEVYRGGRIDQLCRWSPGGELLRFESRDAADSPAGGPAERAEPALGARLAEDGIL